MNAREREQYLREYSILKNQGKPFFPYAVAKDSLMAVVVMIVIIVLAILFGAELGRRRIHHHHVHAASRVVLLLPLRAAAGGKAAEPRVPGHGRDRLSRPAPPAALHDRSPRRNPLRRPIAVAAGVATIAAMAYLTVLGALAFSHRNRAGHRAAVRGGQGDHRLGGLPSRATRSARTAAPSARTSPTSVRSWAHERSPERWSTPLPMPSFQSLRDGDPEQFDKLVEYVASLKGEE